MNLYWPIALIVCSNIFYHICSKQTPENIHPLASVTITYAVGAVFAALLYYLTAKDADLLREYSRLNWTAFVLGLAIVGLEAGNIYMYRVGWNINTGYILNSGILAVALILVGYFLFGESITLTKCLGTLIALAGLWLIQK